MLVEQLHEVVTDSHVDSNLRKKNLASRILEIANLSAFEN